MLGENAVKVVNLLDEGILLGEPDSLCEVGEVEGVGEGGGFGCHGISSFWIVVLLLSLFVVDGT